MRGNSAQLDSMVELCYIEADENCGKEETAPPERACRRTEDGFPNRRVLPRPQEPEQENGDQARGTCGPSQSAERSLPYGRYQRPRPFPKHGAQAIRCPLTVLIVGERHAK